jgi:hypothetical protein
MARLDFRGGAAKCTASASVAIDATTITLVGDTSGWPTGASSRNFMAIIDRGVAGKMEKVLCSALAGGVLTIASRGYDGTAAVTHDANATIEHGLGASLLDDLSGHVYDDTRDDHQEYMRVDGSRAFTDLDTVADAPVAVGTSNQEGVAETLARSDHVHDIADNAVGSAQIAPDAVGTSEIATDAVTSAEIAADAVGTAEIAADAVTSSEIATDAVGNAELHADAATLAKLHKAIHVGSVSGVTDGSGNFVVTHGADFTPSAVFVQMITPAGGANAGHPVVTAIGATTFTGRMIGTAGSMAALSISAYFLCVA